MVVVRRDPQGNFFVFVILTAVLGIIGKNKRKRETEAALISRERDDLFGSRGFRIDGRGANRKRQRMLFTERYNNLTEVEFQSRYKLDKESFGDLVVRLTPVLAKDYAQAKHRADRGSLWSYGFRPRCVGHVAGLTRIFVICTGSMCLPSTM